MIIISPTFIGRTLWNDGRCLSVRLSVCRVPRPNSRTERPRKPKIGVMEVHHTSNQWIYLEVKRSKVKVTRQINDVIDNARYGGNSRDAKVKVKAYSIKYIMGRDIFFLDCFYCRSVVCLSSCWSVCSAFVVNKRIHDNFLKIALLLSCFYYWLEPTNNTLYRWWGW